MSKATRVYGLIAILLVAFGAPANSGHRDAPTILEFISLWLQSEYQMARPASQPDIFSIPSEEMQVRRYGSALASNENEIVALYDAKAGAILVSENWTGDSVAEISILVHELVHHHQAEAGTVFACPAEREKLAYRAQEDWLQLFGHDLKSSFGIDRTLILLATVCTH